MPHIVADRVLESSTTTGTGALTLAAAVTGFRRFSAVCAVADTVPYFLEAVDANGVPTGDWETGVGTYSAANTLTRTTVLASSNAGAAVNLAAGSKYVALGSVAARSPYYDNTLAMPMPVATSEPPTPPAGTIFLYAREIIPGNSAFKIKRPSGVDSPIQDALAFNRMVKCVGSNNAVTTVGAANFTFAGTAAAVTPTSGSMKTQIQRVRYSSAATAGAITTFVAPNAGACPVFRGNVNGEGGWRIVARFSLQTLQVGNRFFSGIAATVTAATGAAFDPLTTAAPARIGLAFNANTGNWQLQHGDGTAVPTNIDLGADFPLNTTSFMELCLFCSPHNGSSAGSVGYRVRRYTTSSAEPAFEATGTVSTKLPAATTLLHPYGFFSNNATAAAVSWEFTSFSIESDS